MNKNVYDLMGIMPLKVGDIVLFATDIYTNLGVDLAYGLVKNIDEARGLVSIKVAGRRYNGQHYAFTDERYTWRLENDGVAVSMDPSKLLLVMRTCIPSEVLKLFGYSRF